MDSNSALLEVKKTFTIPFWLLKQLIAQHIGHAPEEISLEFEATVDEADENGAILITNVKAIYETKGKW